MDTSVQESLRTFESGFAAMSKPGSLRESGLASNTQYATGYGPKSVAKKALHGEEYDHNTLRSNSPWIAIGCFGYQVAHGMYVSASPAMQEDAAECLFRLLRQNVRNLLKLKEEEGPLYPKSKDASLTARCV